MMDRLKRYQKDLLVKVDFVRAQQARAAATEIDPFQNGYLEGCAKATEEIAEVLEFMIAVAESEKASD